MKRVIQLIISLMVSVTIFIFLFKSYPLNSFKDVLDNLQFHYVVIGGLIMGFQWLVNGARWKFLFNQYNYITSVNSTVIALASNVIIPAHGGEFVRAVYLKKETGIPIAESLGKIVVERLLDFFSLFLLLIIAFFVGGDTLRKHTTVMIFIFCIIFISAIGFLIIYKKKSSVIERVLINFGKKFSITNKIVMKILEMFHSIINIKFSVLLS